MDSTPPAIRLTGRLFAARSIAGGVVQFPPLQLVPKGPALLTSPVHRSEFADLSILDSTSKRAFGALPHP